MTLDEALQVLGLASGEDPDKICEAYSTRSDDLTQRIASAPAPTLRAVFEQQSARLREACDLLLRAGDVRPHPTPLSLTRQADLPRRTPSTTGLGSDHRAHAPGQGVERDQAANRRDLPAPYGASSGSQGDQTSLTPGQILAERY